MPVVGKKQVSVVAPLKPYWQTTDAETVRLYHGDVMEVLARLPSRSVQMVVTSPPYWGLRDYQTGEWEGGNDPNCNHKRGKELKYDPKSTLVGTTTTQNNSQRPWLGGVCSRCGARRVDQQIGSEKTPEEFVAKMVAVFGEIKRVLRNDGTVWLNLGDSYGGGTTGGYSNKSTLVGYTGEHTKGRQMSRNQHNANKVDSELRSGNLVGIPWRVALALQADGWILRQDIIWHKPSPMPESVSNRCTRSHEYIFLLTRSGDYYYDAEAIREKNVTPEDSVPAVDDMPSGSYTSRNTALTDGSGKFVYSRSACVNPMGRNKRSVWTISSPGYAGAHFATYPPKLIEPCILAGTSEYGACVECGAPWRRVVEEKKLRRERPNEYVKRIPMDHEKKQNTPGVVPRSKDFREKYSTCANTVAGVEVTTVGWEQGCGCETEEVRPCIVLDPFIGSGTTAEVCIDHGRSCWGIDLSEEYLKKNAIPRIEGALLSRPGMATLVAREATGVVVGKTVEGEAKKG